MTVNEMRYETMNEDSVLVVQGNVLYSNQDDQKDYPFRHFCI